MNEQKKSDIEVTDVNLDNEQGKEEVSKTESNEELNKVFNLDEESDREELGKEINSSSIYFKPEKDVTYKVILTSPMVQKVEKQFNDGPVTKYVIAVKTENKAGEVFEGLWEVGITIIDAIFKNYSKDVVFKITKTGTGLDTKYSVIADF